MAKKRKPTFDLASIRRAVSSMIMTRAAVTGAAAMGITRRDMEDAIRGLTARDFVKSMTAHHDHRAWMDVYHGRFGDYVIYIKFAGDAASGFICTSFRER